MAGRLFLGLIGATGIGLTGTYYSTMETVNNHVDMVTTDSVNEDKAWKKLLEKLESVNGDESPKTGFFTGERKPTNITELAQRCKELQATVYKSYTKEEDPNLITDAKAFCTLKISEMIDEGKKFDVSVESRDKITDSHADKDKLKTNQQTLKNNRASATTDLRKIGGDVIDSWKDLLLWCKKSYDMEYINSKEKHWALVDKYCKRG